MFAMGDPPDYEPAASKSIAAIAARSNHTPDEVAYDYLAGGLDKFLFFPVIGYNEDNHDVIHTMLTDRRRRCSACRMAARIAPRSVDAERCRPGC